MLKNKKMTIVAASVLALALGTGSIFAFFLGKDNQEVVVGAAELQFCFNQKLENNLDIGPGKTGYIEEKYLNPANVGDDKLLYISNGGDTPLVANIDYKIEMYLAKGVVPTTEFEADYELDADKGLYKFKPQRVAQTAKVIIENFDTMPNEDYNGVQMYKIIGDQHYVFLDVDAQMLVNPLQLEVSGELGGGKKDPITGIRTKSRPFEANTTIKVTPTSKAIPNQKTRCEEAFGQDAINQLPAEWFKN